MTPSFSCYLNDTCLVPEGFIIREQSMYNWRTAAFASFTSKRPICSTDLLEGHADDESAQGGEHTDSSALFKLTRSVQKRLESYSHQHYDDQK